MSAPNRLKRAQLLTEIFDIVTSQHEGLWCPDVLRKYKERHGCDMDLASAGFSSVLDAALATGRLEARREGGDWHVYNCALLEPPPPLPARPQPRSRHRSPPPDPEDALPGIPYDKEVFPQDCLHYTETIPAASLDEVRARDMLDVLVCEVYSPARFWLQRFDHVDHMALEEIMDDMKAYFRSDAGRDRYLAPGAVRVGHHCVNYYRDDWRRSVIVKVLDNYTVKVRHVDSGTVSRACIAELRPLLRRWAQVPAQAVRAHVAALAPAAGARRWPHPAVTAFRALVTRCLLVAVIIRVDSAARVLEIMLVNTHTDVDVNINSEMVRRGHAERCLRASLAESECFLWPSFSAIEEGDTPSYQEIRAYLRTGVVVDSLEEYRRHVLPPSPPPSPPPAFPPAPSSYTAGQHASAPSDDMPHSFHTLLSLQDAAPSTSRLPREAERAAPRSPREAERAAPRSPREAERAAPRSPREAERAAPRSPREAERAAPRSPREAERAASSSPRDQ